MAKTSVIRAGHYFDNIGTTKPTETFQNVYKGRDPKITLDIHDVSEVNSRDRDISQIHGPATSLDYKEEKKLSHKDDK